MCQLWRQTHLKEPFVETFTAGTTRPSPFLTHPTRPYPTTRPNPACPPSSTRHEDKVTTDEVSATKYSKPIIASDSPANPEEFLKAFLGCWFVCLLTYRWDSLSCARKRWWSEICRFVSYRTRKGKLLSCVNFSEQLWCFELCGITSSELWTAKLMQSIHGPQHQFLEWSWEKQNRRFDITTSIGTISPIFVEEKMKKTAPNLNLQIACTKRIPKIQSGT